MKEKMIRYYIDLAKRTSELSYAEKLKVGAILVKDDKIISHSWNGMARGFDNTCEDKIWYTQEDKTILSENELTEKYPYVEYSNSGECIGRYYLKTKPEVTHAEEAMLMKVACSNESTEGASLFCTHSCCMNCAKLIYGSKITNFYYIHEYRCSSGIEFLKKCKINVIKIEE